MGIFQYFYLVIPYINIYNIYLLKGHFHRSQDIPGMFAWCENALIVARIITGIGMGGENLDMTSGEAEHLVGLR